MGRGRGEHVAQAGVRARLPGRFSRNEGNRVTRIRIDPGFRLLALVGIDLAAKPNDPMRCLVRNRFAFRSRFGR